MEFYDPSQAPDATDWLAIHESDRIDMVVLFHEENDEEVPDGIATVHATIHVVVENQIALGVEPVPKTIAKLLRQGLSRHEAIHAVGAVLSEDIFNLLQKGAGAWSQGLYRRRLEKLTAKRWKKGQW